MADYLYSMTFNDDFSGVVTRSYHIIAADFIAARVISDAMLLAATNLSTAGIQKDSLAEQGLPAVAAGAGSNIDVGATFQYDIGGGKRASLNFPAPLTSVINPDRSVDLADGLVVAWHAQFVAGNVLISDGEGVISVLRGTLDK
ncbi:MAG: hypothetical protein KAJ19_19495 [Gammaproteobacteria bacterium]|nr:hypothetical protein [Gammaproteobacteria bacterium]